MHIKVAKILFLWYNILIKLRGVTMINNNKIDRNQSMIISLDEMVPENSIVRVIDAYVHSLDVVKLGYHVHTNKVGRPPYKIQDLIALFIYGYLYYLISSRILESHTYINIEVMWLLNNAHPDHSTIAAFRSKNAEALANTFRDFVCICKDLNLIGGKIVAVDGTKIHANNNKKNNYSKKSLQKKIQHIDEQITEYFSELDKNDKSDIDLKSLSDRKSKYEDLLEKLEESEETQISTVDPDARLMDNKKGGLDVAYNIQATVDAKNGLVIDQYVINAPTDQGELSNAASRAKKILSTKELIVLADKGYYNGEDLEKCLDMCITPVVARQNPPKRKGMYSIDEFVYNPETDSFSCPQNNILTKISGEDAKTTVYANKFACKSCPYKSQCFKQNARRKYRTINKDKHFPAMVKADAIYKVCKKLYKRRQELNEPVFDCIKRQLGFPQLNVRTKRKVEGEVSLLFLGYNLKRVIKLIGNTELIQYLRARRELLFKEIVVFFMPLSIYA